MICRKMLIPGSKDLIATNDILAISKTGKIKTFEHDDDVVVMSNIRTIIISYIDHA